MSALADELGIARLHIKDERTRMGLGSFKALGAAFAIARAADEAKKGSEEMDWTEVLKGQVFVTASAGNHGLSVAAGARIFGAKAVIYLARTVPEAFAKRLRALDAEVVRAGHNYEESMEAAATAAETIGTLLSDSSWQGYEEMPLRVMEGYLQLAVETVSQIDSVPTHIFLQAGVGGLAAAVAAHARAVWGDAPQIIVVEPDAAPALFESVRAGALVTTTGPASGMGRLDCKTPSMIALAGLSRDADLFVTLSEEQAEDTVFKLGKYGLHSTPSGVAGIAAVFSGLVPLSPKNRVLVILSERPEGV
ncbi:MAG: pyridoxal-phosphate dependent enzyme [Pseudomonadota bacterium]